MGNEIASIWSAVAASFAALSSFFIYRTQVKSFNHTARPDLVLEDWARTVGDSLDLENISFSRIENIGNGSAQHIYIHAFGIADDDRPTFVMATTRVPVLAKNSSQEINTVISINWKNVPLYNGDQKHLSIKIGLVCWDTVGIRHSKSYNLFVVKDTQKQLVADSIAPGVMLGSLAVVSTPVWRLKVYSKLGWLPFIGKRLKSRVNI